MTLKTVTMRRLSCDRDGCESVTDVTGSDGIEARFEAAAIGWRYSARSIPGRKGSARRYDYCPIHAQEVPE
jgi:hypothetical protein